MIHVRFLCHKNIFLILVLLGCLILGACAVSEDKNQKSTDNNESKEDENYSYIKNTYGFAEDLLYGEYTAIISRDGNSYSVEKTTRFKPDTKGGAVFYKSLQSDDTSKEYVCVYFEDGDATNNEISLSCKKDKISKDGNIQQHTILLATPHMKSRCYCMVKDHYLIVTELSEKNEGWYDKYYYLAYEEAAISSSNLSYQETIKVYDLKDELKEKMTVTREIDPGQKTETKRCEIVEGDKEIIYASGYSSFSHDSAELINTEQEFCDRANSVLSKYSVDEIKFTRTSWKNRWYRLEVDETGITKDEMVKVDFGCTPGQVNGDMVTSDIVIKVNAEKEQHGVLSDEGEDIPVEYNLNENASNESKQKEEQNINGTWISSDERYVYRFKCKQGSMGIDYSGISVADGEFSYVDTKQGKKRIDGSFTFSGDNTITITDNLSKGESTSFTIDGDELISDKITLKKVLDEAVTQFEGSWEKPDETIIFDNDGTFEDKKEYHDSTWGYYYVLSTTKILLSNKSSNFRVLGYSISGNNMTLGTKNLKRTSGGADADALLSLKNTIIGAWRRPSTNDEYRFASDGTWERYIADYAESELLSETFLESGTYKVLNDKMIEIDRQGGISFNRLSYNASTGILSGDGISLEKLR